MLIVLLGRGLGVKVLVAVDVSVSAPTRLCAQPVRMAPPPTKSPVANIFLRGNGFGSEFIDK